MEAEFWHERWRQHQIGFHQPEVNSHLKNFWQQMHVPQDSGVLVPLCGKSLDLLWLVGQKYRVVGVELSEIAVTEFCAENHLQTVPQDIEAGRLWQFNNNVSLICKDFFRVSPDETGKINAVYDRAALVALPPEMRKKYASHLTSLLEPGAKILLVAFEYDQQKMQGPPFSVPEHEVRQLYGEKFSIDEISISQTRSQSARLAAMPANEQVKERVYILKKQ